MYVNVCMCIRVHVCVCTLCEELQGADLLSDAELQDLLQDVLSLALLHDPHPLQLPVCQPHQSSACRHKELEFYTVTADTSSKLLPSDMTQHRNEYRR